MRIAIPGATGYVGRHLTARLKTEGHDIIPIARGVGLPKADMVINCAANLAAIETMWQDNVLDLGEWVAQAAAHRIPRFIHLGSSSEVGSHSGPRSEEATCKPVDLYGASKVMGSAAVLMYGSMTRLSSVVLRPFTVYGGTDDTSRKMLPSLWRAYKARSSFTCYEGGHDWIHIDDLVEGIMRVIAAPVDRTSGQIINLGTGISSSNAYITKLFNEAVGGDLKVTYPGTRYRVFDVDDWRADTAKMKALLGWEPKIRVEDGVRRFVEEMALLEEGAPGL